jgi:hypothetical protein
VVVAATGASHKILIRQAVLLRLDSQFSLSLLAVGTPATIHPMAVAEAGAMVTNANFDRLGVPDRLLGLLRRAQGGQRDL